MVYATVADLEARWRDLTPDEAERASFLLEDAGAILERYEQEGADPRILTMVSVNMVKRAMEAQGDAFGLGQDGGGGGWSPYNPAGAVEPPTAKEVRLLRGKPPRIGFLPMASE